MKVAQTQFQSACRNLARMDMRSWVEFLDAAQRIADQEVLGLVSAPPADLANAQGRSQFAMHFMKLLRNSVPNTPASPTTTFAETNYPPPTEHEPL